MRSFTQLFTGFNEATTNDDKKNIRLYKVKKAVDFLTLPEIRNIDAFNTKVKFLKTRGLNDGEIEEAFNQLERSAALRVNLHEVSGDVIPEESSTSLAITLPQNQTSSLSTVFSFCHKLLMFAGIATSCYYLYQQWLAMKTKLSKSKKESATIEAELKKIKLEVLRLADGLRECQELQEKNTTHLSDGINSLKAILTSRQYFEEKKSSKLTMPSWQLVTHSQDSATASTAAQDTTDLQSSQTNGHVEGIEPKTIPSKSKSQNGTSVDETVLSKRTDTALNSSVTNGGCVAENESVCNVVKESGTKGSEKKKEAKKSDKKSHPKN